MCAHTTAIDPAEIMAALVPFLQALEEGIVFHLDHLKSRENPVGAVLVRGTFFSFARDMPQV